MRTTIATALLAAAALACGCEENPAPRAPLEEVQAPEITRDVAVSEARRDAAVRFRDLRVSFVNVQPVGKFWVIELRDPVGRGVRYGISRNDGSIRERTTLE